MKKDFAVLADQITSALDEFAGTAKKEARRNYKQARSSVDEVVTDLSKRGSAAVDTAYDTALSWEESLEEAIGERPLATVGIAVAIGFLIGATWRR